MQRYTTYLVVTIAIVVVALGATLLAGNTPVLGLDLQGGISVVLQPVGKHTTSSLDVARDIINSRVDALGVAEPEISRQGDTIVIDLPGVKNRDKAQRIVGRTGELRFRPVIVDRLPPEGKGGPTAATTPRTTAPGSTAATTTTTPSTEAAQVKAILAQCPSNPDAAVSAMSQLDLSKVPSTSPEANHANACVILPNRKKDKPQQRYLLGPAAMTGKDTSSAQARFSAGQGYVVDLNLKGSGQDKINKLAAALFPKQRPQNEMAIELDGVVQSAPAFQTSNFGSGAVQISGNFNQTDSSDLAKLLNYGALPVQLKPLTTENVSPTLGSDQLAAGIAAGVIGLALVALYMLFYYRILGVVVFLGLGVSAALTYALISYLGQSRGLTLTLAGVTGLIVSVGITVDSYVVYFERLKDEVRMGKTVRSSVDRGFTRAFRTILAADLVSLIGAGALYALAVGSVRGFAFYLGLSTLLDLLVAYFFMHPLVVVLARRPGLVRLPYVGIGSGLDSAEATA